MYDSFEITLTVNTVNANLRDQNRPKVTVTNFERPEAENFIMEVNVLLESFICRITVYFM